MPGTLRIKAERVEVVKIPCPHCGHNLTSDQIRSLWGRFRASFRVTATPGPGRPRTKLRCACGAMTVERAEKRNHKC